jgi:hypothetical protein
MALGSGPASPGYIALSKRIRAAAIVIGLPTFVCGAFAVLTTTNGAGSATLLIVGASFLAVGGLGLFPTSFGFGDAKVSFEGKVVGELIERVGDPAVSEADRLVAGELLLGAYEQQSGKLSTSQLADLNGVRPAEVSRLMAKHRTLDARPYRCRMKSCDRVLVNDHAGMFAPACPDHSSRMVPDLAAVRAQP